RHFSNTCLPRTHDRVTFHQIASPAMEARMTDGTRQDIKQDTGTHGPDALPPRQRQVVEFIDAEVRRRGYPPSVREIGEAVGLSSSSTVHAHLAALQDKGFLKRDPTKPRAIEVCFESGSGAVVERRPVRHVPLIGDVAAGTGVL